MKSNLKLVADTPIDPAPGQLLRTLLPALELSERHAKELRWAIDQQGRRLAQERGVAFIRFEHLKNEFGA